MKSWLKIHPADTVAVALVPLPAGTQIRPGLRLPEAVPQGHKFALTDIPAGEPVIKYGSPIGTAVASIPAGSRVHTHNLKTRLGDALEYEYRPSFTALPPREPATFQGFRREGGRAGVRNQVWIIPTVGCVNDVAAAIEREASRFATGTVEGVLAFRHPYGCSQMGEDQENTRRILAGLANHPNAGGVLVLGLGCENSGIEVLKGYIGGYDPRRVKFLQCQDVEDEIAEGVRLTGELCEYAGSFHREAVPVSELVIGLKCGGSDGLSGVTANPVVGRFSDLLLSQGGSAILTEVPEMFGAEQGLMDRCVSREVFDKAAKMVNGFKEYFQRHGQVVYENPSPGNKAGGISTLEDKSLGCVQKSGSAPIVDVLDYGGTWRTPGLTLLSGPGNDLVAATALAAAGAQMVLFTTGRGTPFASPVPTVKISSSSALAAKKANWIDFDCGPLIEDRTLDELGKELFDYVLEAASGRRVKSEAAGFHDLAIFKQGVTL